MNLLFFLKLDQNNDLCLQQIRVTHLTSNFRTCFRGICVSEVTYFNVISPIVEECLSNNNQVQIYFNSCKQVSTKMKEIINDKNKMKSHYYFIFDSISTSIFNHKDNFNLSQSLSPISLANTCDSLEKDIMSATFLYPFYFHRFFFRMIRLFYLFFSSGKLST